MRTRIHKYPALAAGIAILLSAALAGCKNLPPDKITKRATALVREARDASNADLLIASAKLKEAAYLVRAYDLPPELRRLNAEKRAIKEARENEEKAIRLGKEREYGGKNGALALLKRVVADAPRAYRGVARASTEKTMERFEKANNVITKWRKNTAALENQFKRGTAYICWADPYRLDGFTRADLDSIVAGYKQGYDSPMKPPARKDGPFIKQPSQFKIGWVLGATGQARDAVACFGKALSAGKKTQYDEQNRARLYTAILHETQGDFRRAESAWTKVKAHGLPAELAAIVKRKMAFYDNIRRSGSADGPYARMKLLVEANLNTIRELDFRAPQYASGAADGKRLFPSAARAVGRRADDAFRQWFEEDWTALYSGRPMTIRYFGTNTEGRTSDWSWTARTRAERAALQPAFKFTYFMLWRVNQPKIDLVGGAMSAAFRWFDLFAEGNKPNIPPDRQAESFARRAKESFHTQPEQVGRYFSLAGKGDWSAAFGVLERLKWAERDKTIKALEKLYLKKRRKAE